MVAVELASGATGCELPRVGAVTLGRAPLLWSAALLPMGGCFTESKLTNARFLFCPGGALEKFEICGGRGSLPA